MLAVLGYVLWVEQIWAMHESDDYWRLLGLVLTWALATLLVCTNRLMLSAPRLLRTLYPATAAVTFLAALTVTVMLARENGDGWQFFAVLLILALLGEVLAPILERYAVVGDAAPERPLGRVGGTEVVAVRGQPRTVNVGGERFTLRSDEGVVVRPAG